MSILASILGGSAAQPIDAIGNVFDRLFTTAEERAIADQAMQKLRQHPGELQAEINKIEAGHRSIFVAGWRPAIGWVCSIALLYQFVIHPLLADAVLIYSPATPPPPPLDFGPLMTVVLSLLGLGGLRTVEKLKGRTK